MRLYGMIPCSAVIQPRLYDQSTVSVPIDIRGEQMLSSFGRFWDWLRENDAPNWIVILFSLLTWPLFLFLRPWDRRNRQSIPHLQVRPQQNQVGMTIDGKRFDAIDLIFTNQTGCVVYLYRAQLRASPKRFPIPLEACQDMSDGWCDLKFGASYNNTVVYNYREWVAQTNTSIMAIVPVSRKLDERFYAYRPWLLRKWLRWPKYFLLQYTVMVGDRKYAVRTVY